MGSSNTELLEPIFAFSTRVSDSGDKIEAWAARKRTLYGSQCPFCLKRCESFSEEFGYDDASQTDTASFCLRCGWWSYEADQHSDLNGEAYYYSSCAVLERFNIDDVDVPSDALANYIADNGQKIQDIAPIKFEELVADIFKECLGYKIESVSYGRPDRGIDIIFCEVGNLGKSAIQVKRYKNPIKLELIHQFCGAMIDGGFRTGTFITTSRFQKGCQAVVESIRNKIGIEIDLVDGRRVLEFLDMFPSNSRAHSIDWHETGYTASYGRKKLPW